MIGKIYKVTNLINGKLYVGQTIQNDKKGHGILISKAYRKYGKTNFRYEVIEYVHTSKLDEREKFYISLYESQSPNGYNLTSGGKGGMSGWNRGLTKRENISLKLSGERHSKLRKDKFWSSWNRGLSKETCDKLKQSGEKQSLTKRNTKRIPWNKGLTGIYSDDHIEKLKESGKESFTKNNPMNSEDSRKKVSESKIGRKIYIDSDGKRRLGPKQEVKP